MHVCGYVCMYERMFVWMYVRLSIYVCIMYVCMFVSKFMWIYAVCICVFFLLESTRVWTKIKIKFETYNIRGKYKIQCSFWTCLIDSRTMDSLTGPTFHETYLLISNLLFKCTVSQSNRYPILHKRTRYLEKFPRWMFQELNMKPLHL